MTRMICRSNVKACGVAIVALGILAPVAWSQQTDEFNPDTPRAARNDQGSTRNYDSDQSYSDRGSNQSDYSGRNQSDNQSYGQRDTRGQRDSQYNESNQDSRFGDRRDNRGEFRDRDDQSRADRRQDRRADRNEEDGPAGLGVMLDTSGGTIEVREVARRSPAARAGIEQGDRIIAVNGRQLNSAQQLTQIIRQQEPGSEIDIRLRRDGQQRTVTAQLESLSDALDTLERERFERWRDAEDSFANSPPWGDDQLMQHVDELEQQVRRMQQEIDDLRLMLNSSPSEQRFSQRNERESRFRD